MSTMNSSAGPLMSSASANPQFLPAPSPSSSHSSLPVNHLPPTPGINVSIATQSQTVETPQSDTEASRAQIAEKVLTHNQALVDKIQCSQRIPSQQQLHAQFRELIEAQKKLAGPGLNQGGPAEFNDAEVSIKLEVPITREVDSNQMQGMSSLKPQGPGQPRRPASPQSKPGTSTKRALLPHIAPYPFAKDLNSVSIKDMPSDKFAADLGTEGSILDLGRDGPLKPFESYQRDVQQSLEDFLLSAGDPLGDD